MRTHSTCAHTALPLENTGGSQAPLVRQCAQNLGCPSDLCEMGRTPDSAATRAQLQPGAASDLLSFVVVLGSADVNAEFSREAEREKRG